MRLQITARLREKSKKLLRFFSLRSAIEQLLIVGIIAITLYYLGATTASNLEERGIATGFDFLFKAANVGVSEAWIRFTPGVDSYIRLLIAGLLNTLFVSFVAIALATFAGVFLGLARLSPNWLISRCAGMYVEIVRNVPLPLHLLLYYNLLLSLPPPRNALTLLDVIVLTNRGLYAPKLIWQDAYGYLTLAMTLLIAALFLFRRFSMPKQRWRLAIPLIISAVVLLLLTVITATPIEYDAPVLKRFNFHGGVVLSPELTALVLGLSLYGAAFVGEIIRAGMLSVPAGQWEAGRSLGLSNRQILKKIVFPLTLRVTIPPLASEYLSILRNSSLAVIIGYPELTSLINTMLSDSGQPIEAIVILMLAYLTLSALISLLMIWYERRTRIVTQ